MQFYGEYLGMRLQPEKQTGVDDNTELSALHAYHRWSCVSLRVGLNTVPLSRLPRVDISRTWSVANIHMPIL